MSSAAARLRFGEHVFRFQHAFDRPAQIHRRRASLAHARYGIFECRVVGDLRAQKRDAVSAENPDAWRAAHRERFYGVFEVFCGKRAPDDRLMRKRALIDVLDRVAGPANGFRCFDR